MPVHSRNVVIATAVQRSFRAHQFRVRYACAETVTPLPPYFIGLPAVSTEEPGELGG